MNVRKNTGGKPPPPQPVFTHEKNLGKIEDINVLAHFNDMMDCLLLNQCQIMTALAELRISRESYEKLLDRTTKSYDAALRCFRLGCDFGHQKEKRRAAEKTTPPEGEAEK